MRCTIEGQTRIFSDTTLSIDFIHICHLKFKNNTACKSEMFSVNWLPIIAAIN